MLLKVAKNTITLTLFILTLRFTNVGLSIRIVMFRTVPNTWYCMFHRCFIHLANCDFIVFHLTGMLCFTDLVFRIWIAIFRFLSQWYFIFNIDIYVRLKIKHNCVRIRLLRWHFFWFSFDWIRIYVIADCLRKVWRYRKGIFCLLIYGSWYLQTFLLLQKIFKNILTIKVWYFFTYHRISGEMVSVLTSSAVDRVFEPWSGRTKYYEIGICCFSAKHTALRRKIKDWLAQNQDNVFEWGDMLIRGLLFQWASTINIQLRVLV